MPEESLVNRVILVVDDEPMLREMLSDVLQMADYDVVTATNGEEGLAQLRAESPDLEFPRGSSADRAVHYG